MLACAAKGAAPQLVCTLVLACVDTQTDYACTIWFKPKATVRMVQKLERVQKVALKMVSGGFKTAALSALEVEANMLPVRLRLQLRTLKVALHTISQPPSHPLYSQAIKARSALPSRHPSPLHLLLDPTPLLPPSLSVETIHPFPIPPWDHLSPPISVAGLKELALEAVQKLIDGMGEDNVAMYSDGSLMEGCLGAGLTIQMARRDNKKGRERDGEGGS